MWFTLLLAMAAPSQGEPQASSTLLPDVRCFIATSVLAQSQDPAMAQIGLLASMFWFGRVDRRMTDRELEKLMKEQAMATTSADLKLDLQRCGDEMKVRGQVMTQIGQRISRQEEKRDLR